MSAGVVTVETEISVEVNVIFAIAWQQCATLSGRCVGIFYFSLCFIDLCFNEFIFYLLLN